jgi:hypothetical protein
MQFLLLCCFEEGVWNGLAEGQRATIMQDYGRLMHGLKESGHLLSGAKLGEAASAVTVRQRGGKANHTDGPFAETKEQLGGYHLLECRDQDEAIAIAQRIPTLAVGGVVEVRRVEYLER